MSEQLSLLDILRPTTEPREIAAADTVTLRPYQNEAVEGVFSEWDSGSQSTLVCLPTGCHAAGHPILMHGGEVRAVEDIEVGDWLTGPDGKPREVMRLVRGREELFTVKPKGGPEFTVNGGHILHLESTNEGKGGRYKCQKTGGEIDHVTVREYLAKSTSWKHLRKLKSTGVEFTDYRAEKPVHPYVIGALLGDGTNKKTATILHSQEVQIVCEVRRLIDGLGCKIVTKDVPGKSAVEHHIVAKKKWEHTELKRALRSLCVSGSRCPVKAIPDDYKFAPSEERLQLLAGLIDTDGHLSSGKVYDFVSKSRWLAEDVAFVSRSLGFRANMARCLKSSQNGTQGVYWRVCISGDIERIPCRVPRKQAQPRLQKKDWTRYGFTVEYAGVGDYYGFVLDNDHLYVDGNFFIHHNCGKSVVFSDVMRRHPEWNGRILLLAHREELIYQGVGHAKRAGLSVGIEMGNQRARTQDVIVSTVQTQTAFRKCRSCFGEGCDLCEGRGKRRRMESFNPRSFGLVVIDEGHHATAKSYRTVLKHFRQNADLRVLLVTATPKRADGVGLHNVCDSVAYEMDLRSAIDGGWLCPIRQRFVTVEGLDLSEVGTKAGGDLADGELERAILGEDEIEEQKRLHEYVKPTLDEAAGRPVLFFAAGCEHAEKITAAFNAYDGVTAELVLGTTDKDERRRIVSRYKSGETQVLVGVGVFTEGFDAPGTHVVAVARSTKSESLYLQMIGRGTRPLPGIVDGPEAAEARRQAIADSDKPHCIILDFVGNSGRHKLVSVADVLAGDDIDERDLVAAVDVAKRSAEPVDMEELVERVKQARERKEADQAAERERLRASHRATRAEYTAEDVDIFGGSRFATHDDQVIPTFGASESQARKLLKLGVPRERIAQMNRAQASIVINEITKRTGPEFVMPFGKHSGKPLKQVPRGYLQWAAANINHPRVSSEVNAFLNGGR